METGGSKRGGGLAGAKYISLAIGAGEEEESLRVKTVWRVSVVVVTLLLDQCFPL